MKQHSATFPITLMARLLKVSISRFYDPKDKDQAIQITKYLDWIKANYATALTFKADKGVQAK